MKNFVLKYHLEAYTLFAALITVLGFFNIYTLTSNRKLILIIIVIGVFHEWEEKRFPGGFFEKLGTIWGWDMNTVDLRKPGQWVIYAWLIIAFIPFIFDNVTGLLLAPLFLGIFEMIIHTAGKKICNIKGWYVPGIITGWLMGIASIYCIVALNKITTITFIDCLIGILCVIVVMVILQVMVQKSANSSIPQMITHMRNRVHK